MLLYNGTAGRQRKLGWMAECQERGSCHSVSPRGRTFKVARFRCTHLHTLQNLWSIASLLPQSQSKVQSGDHKYTRHGECLLQAPKLCQRGLASWALGSASYFNGHVHRSATGRGGCTGCAGGAWLSSAAILPKLSAGWHMTSHRRSVARARTGGAVVHRVCTETTGTGEHRC